jgi:hypothetical protein
MKRSSLGKRRCDQAPCRHPYKSIMVPDTSNPPCLLCRSEAIEVDQTLTVNPNNYKEHRILIHDISPDCQLRQTLTQHAFHSVMGTAYTAQFGKCTLCDVRRRVRLCLSNLPFSLLIIHRWHPTRPTNARDRAGIDHVVLAFGRLVFLRYHSPVNNIQPTRTTLQATRPRFRYPPFAQSFLMQRS